MSGFDSVSPSASSRNSVGADFCENLVKGIVEPPAQALEQIWDELRGTKATPVSHAEETDATGQDSGAARAGFMLGNSLALVGLAALTHKVLPAGVLETNAGRVVAGASLGAGYSTLFTPVYGSTDDFWDSKMKDAAVSGLTVATMSAFKAPLLNSESRLVNMSHGALSGFSTGSIAGLVNAEVSSALKDHSFASSDKLVNSALTFGLGGAVFGGLSGGFTRPIAAGEQTPTEQREFRAMPLPKEISSDPNPSVGKDEWGNVMILTKDGLSATYKDGRWQPGFLFSSLSWMNEFTRVTDSQEADSILTQATEALRQDRENNAEYFNKR